jgi:branched-chain amino acid aminotransferase
MTTKIVWMDGELVNWDDATVHVTSLGLHYGIGFFEGIRCHSTPDGPAIFRLADHLRRLARSAAIYGVQLPHSAAEMSLACRAVVAANHLADCYLRPIVFLGEGGSPFSASFRTAIIASANGPLAGPPADGGVRAQISSFQRMSTNAIPPAAKACGQYLSSYLAQAEALRTGSDEAIFLNDSGFVADGWAHNIFVVQDGAVVTPPVSTGALPGITRETIMTLAAEDGLAVQERDLVRTDLYLAGECFLSGTSAGLVPVISVDGRPVGAARPGPVTAGLIERLASVMHGTAPDHPEWREHIA